MSWSSRAFFIRKITFDINCFTWRKKNYLLENMKQEKKNQKNISSCNTHTHNLGNEQILELDKQMITLARIWCLEA